jgi:plasmid stabilization system protein ParE
MPYRITFHPEASKEFKEALHWYEKELSGLGFRFQESIENQLNNIVDNPLLYPKKSGNHREAIVETFPYLIVYKLLAQDNIIFVSAIFHTSRNPKKKYRRVVPRRAK